MSNLMTVAAAKNAPAAPRQGEEFDVHFEQAGDTGDSTSEILADSAQENLRTTADPDDELKITGSPEYSKNPPQGDSSGSPTLDVGSILENLAAKGLLPTGSQSSATLLAHNTGQTKSTHMSGANSEGVGGKTNIANSDPLAMPANRRFAALRTSETSDLLGQAPGSQKQNSGQAVLDLNAAQFRRQLAELLKNGSKTGSEPPRLGELTVKPVRNDGFSGAAKQQSFAPGTLTQQTQNSAVSLENAKPISGGASETFSQTNAFGFRETHTQTDDLSPSRSRRSIRGGNDSTNAAAVSSAKVPVQTADVFKTAQNQSLSAANIQPIAEQHMLASEGAPSEHFVTPLSEPGLQIGNLRTSETMLARPEAARMIASQMAEAVMRAQNNKVEIALHPEELGRVRMVLSTTELGVTVSIVAERVETLDLMRRHIDQLAEEFRELGYQNIGFEFSGGKRNHGSDGKSSNPQSHKPSHPDDQRDAVGSVQIQTARALQSSGLDLRL